MVIGPDFTRGAESTDHDEIEALLLAAFGQPDEAVLVRRLRTDGDMWMELVKPWKGAIAGYAALARMQAPVGWACLAPLAVLPRFQRGIAAPDASQKRFYSIGSRLCSEIAMLAGRVAATPHTIVVLGDNRFYERAGFSATRARKLSSPYPVEHTLIARPGDDVPEETLVYPRAFADL